MKSMKTNKTLHKITKMERVGFMFLTLISAILTTGFAFVISNLIDLIGTGDVSLLMRMLLFSCVFVLVSVAVEYGIAIYKNRLIIKEMKHLKKTLYNRYLAYDHQAYTALSTGTAINDIVTKAGQYEGLYLNTILSVPGTLFSLVLAIGATIYIDYRLLLIMLVFAGGTAYLTKYTSKRIQKSSTALMQANDQHARTLKDQLEGHFLIKTSNLTAFSREKMGRNVDQTMNASYAQKKNAVFAMNASMLLGLLSTVMIMGIAAIFAVKGLITVGMVMAVSQLIGKIVSPISSLGNLSSVLIRKSVPPKEICYNMDIKIES